MAVPPSADGTLSIFGSYDNAVDGMDAKKLPNFGANLSIKTAGKLLVVERKHNITRQDTIFFNLSGVGARQYQFQFIGSEMDPGVEGFLEDSYLQTRTPSRSQ